MGIIKKIRAFFTIKGKQQEVVLESAEINQKGVFLHPSNDTEHSLFINSESIDLLISPGKELEEKDILIIENKKRELRNGEKIGSDGVKRIYPKSLSSFMPPKKRFSVLLYLDEYDSLMNNISINGYQKTEYFLACMTAAKKQSMVAAYKKYTNEHKNRRTIDLIVARKAQEEDYMARKRESEQANEVKTG